MNNYRIIDESVWKRREHCAVFRNYTEPAFCVTFETDITRFLRYVRQNQYSFTLSLIYISAKCANEIEEFRYRFLDGQIVLFDQIDTAFTWLDGQTELFKVVRVPFLPSLREYVAAAGETAEKQREYFTGPLGNDVFQFSPLPWLGYTHISHTVSSKRDAATPPVRLGKIPRMRRENFIALYGAGAPLLRRRSARRKICTETPNRTRYSRRLSHTAKYV